MSRTSLSPGATTLAALEFLLMIACYVLATYAYFGESAATYLLYENGLSANVFTAAALLGALYFQGLYSPRRRRVGLDLILRLVTAMGLVFLLEAVVFYLQNRLALPIMVMLAGAAIGFIGLLSSRLIYNGLVSGLGPERVLLVGATPLNRGIARRIADRPEFGFTVAGYLDDRLEPGTELEGGKVLGCVAELLEICPNLPHHRVIADLSDEELPLRLVAENAVAGRLERPDALYELLFGRVCATRLHPATLLFGGELAPPRAGIVLQSVYANLLALAALMVCAPAMALIAVLVKLSSPGPACEGQRAMGWNLTPFTRLRFRCYKVVETAEGVRRESTALGRWLIRLHLAALPQLLNVLRGEMALVGPPPVRAEFAGALIRALPYYRLRYAVKPGLVGWSQMNAGTEDDTMARLEYDLYYVKYISPYLDFSILLQAISRRPPRMETAAAV